MAAAVASAEAPNRAALRPRGDFHPRLHRVPGVSG